MDSNPWMVSFLTDVVFCPHQAARRVRSLEKKLNYTARSQIAKSLFVHGNELTLRMPAFDGIAII
jgi:hypothetical protein